MLRLFLLQTLRNFRKQKLNSLINVAGLSIGLLSFMLIMLYVQHEMSFDRFHKKSHRIYRLTSETPDNVRAFVPYKWGEFLKDELVEVENVASIQNITIALTVKKGDNIYAQHGIIGADSTFFDIFDFPVVNGKHGEFLKNPNKIVITPKMAEKYFNTDDPIGETLRMNLWGTFVTYEVQGIVECPKNSHLQFEFIIPIQLVKKHFFSQTAFGSWRTHFAYTYLTLTNSNLYDNGHNSIKNNLRDFLERHGGKELTQKFTPDIVPLEDTYLKSSLQFDFPPRGNITHIRILVIVALGILLMALINFINISTAQSLKRIKEFGLKRILGSGKNKLIIQFVCESLFLTFLSSILACIVTFLLVPRFNDFTSTNFFLSSIFNFSNVVSIFGLVIVVGIASGIYPALMLSSIKPVRILSSRSAGKSTSKRAQKALVVIQFSLTILLLAATGVVYEQVDYMKNKDLGFDKDQVIVMDDARLVASDPEKTQLFREKLQKFGGISTASASSSYPGQQPWGSSCLPENYEEGSEFSIYTIYADHDFIKTYDIKILQGRDFNREIQSDVSSVLINEAAAKRFSSESATWITNPIGKKINFVREEMIGSVIGVMKDFHYESLEKEIAPLIISIDPNNFFALQVKLNTRNIPETIDLIKNTWEGLFPETPFTYSFVDKEFAAKLETNRKLGRILQIFGFVSIIVATLGLFGLASFLALERAKEVSIRKVTGATERQLVFLLSWRFLKPVLVANVFALPLSYLIMNKWLEEFAYRIEIPPYLYFMAVLGTIFITILTTIYHARKTSKTNPVDILSQE